MFALHVASYLELLMQFLDEWQIPLHPVRSVQWRTTSPCGIPKGINHKQKGQVNEKAMGKSLRWEMTRPGNILITSMEALGVWAVAPALLKPYIMCVPFQQKKVLQHGNIRRTSNCHCIFALFREVQVYHAKVCHTMSHCNMFMRLPWILVWTLAKVLFIFTAREITMYFITHEHTMSLLKILSTFFSAKAFLISQSHSFNVCKTIILKGWKFNFKCNIHHTLWSDIPNPMPSFERNMYCSLYCQSNSLNVIWCSNSSHT